MLNLGDAAGRIALDGGPGDRKRAAGVDVLGVILGELALRVGQFDNAAQPHLIAFLAQFQFGTMLMT